MKMVKSLLLGSAAGLMAVAGASAAELPVKAAPVEYVKICSLYGAGFYYLPGTDICVKFGGYVRGQYYVNTGNAPSSMVFFTGSGGNQETRANVNTADFVFRSRTIVTMDTRAQTEWGTVRTYMNIGFTEDFNGGPGGTAAALYANRAFIQWAGFTFGKAQSFYDELVVPSYTYFGLYTPDTGDSGTDLVAYTTQWGNGISSTIAIEDPRRQAVVNTPFANGTATIPPGTPFPSLQVVGGNPNNDMVNQRLPDIVSNLRIDQAWGNWQVMSALHDASAAYWFFPCNTDGNTLIQSQQCGYPGDKLGWAVGTGANINLPWITRGDRFGFQVNWTKGATRYAMNQANTNSPGFFGGNYSLGMGFLADAVLRDQNVLVNGIPQTGSLELTDAWSFMAVYEHLWTPALKTSFYGGAVEVSYNGNATNYICANVFNNPGTAGAIGNLNPIGAGAGFTARTCDPDFGIWYVGSRTQWNIRPDFYLGMDLVYQKLETSFDGLAAFASNGPRPSTVLGGGGNNPLYRVENQDALSLTFRVHRDIIP